MPAILLPLQPQVAGAQSQSSRAAAMAAAHFAAVGPGGDPSAMPGSRIAGVPTRGHAAPSPSASPVASPGASPAASPVRSAGQSARPVRSAHAPVANGQSHGQSHGQSPGQSSEPAPADERDRLLGRVVGDKYVLSSRVGSGSFGSVYRAMHSKKGYEVAVKMEPASAKYPQLSHESRMYKLLHERGAVVPRIYWYGGDGGEHQCLVMDLLGPSLTSLFERCGGIFSLETAVEITIQVVSRLEEIHNAGLLHRDIKPDNFCMGSEQNAAHHAVFALDFGCARRWRDAETKRHVPEQRGKCMVGTARYASLRAHLGLSLSRKDDLEAAGYMLVWFLKGRLPWQGLDASSNHERMQKIGDLKATISTKQLCEGLPSEIEAYLTAVHGLQYEDQPDYNILKVMLATAVARHGRVLQPMVFDWECLEQEEAGGASRGGLRFDSPPRRRMQLSNFDAAFKKAGAEGAGQSPVPVLRPL